MVQLFRRGLPSAGLSSRSLLAVAALAAAVFTHCATAQQFPTKPVRVITPFPSGSGPDSVLRVVGDKLSRAWGQQVIVENRPGANGFIAIEAAKKAKPDGYTLVQMDDAHMALQPHLYKQIPYNVAKDFDPVATLFRTYFFVVVPAGSKWKNMSDLIAAAKAKPNDVIYGSWFIGSPGHIGAAMLEAATGTQMTHAPFKEMTQLFAAVANNEVAWSFGSAASIGTDVSRRQGQVSGGGGAEAGRRITDVPTVAEAGGPANFEVKAWVALLAPRGTPNSIIERINADVAKALSEPDVRERLAGFGFEPFASPPGDIAKLIDTDSRRYGEIVKRAKISVD